VRGGGSPWREGQPVVRIERDVAAVRVTDGERDSRRDSLEKVMRRVDPTWRWTGPEIPRTKAAYKRLRVAADGRIWVSPSLPGERTTDATGVTTWREPEMYDIYEPSGAYVGRVAVPPRVSIAYMRGDHVWATTRDADDIPRIQRLRIVWR